MRRVVAIVGLQYGSEGKGQVARSIAELADVVIRVGGPNAGHTVVFPEERAVIKLRQVPAGAYPGSALLLIGPGAVVDPDVLRADIQALREVGVEVDGRLYVAETATWLRPEARRREAGLVRSIGSTGEGVGAARIARIRRQGGVLLRDAVRHHHWLHDYLVTHDEYLELAHAREGLVVLEGTQGYGLSIYHGPWPYTTSADTTAAALAADCGFSPLEITDVAGVVRTKPIRVGGPSGPLRFETTWADLNLAPEYTTVTGRERRVAHFDFALFQRAVLVNRPNLLCVTFLDYLPEQERGPFCRVLEKLAGARVVYRGLGPGVFEAKWEEVLA